jgi:hypothetical protein
MGWDGIEQNRMDQLRVHCCIVSRTIVHYFLMCGGNVPCPNIKCLSLCESWPKQWVRHDRLLIPFIWKSVYPNPWPSSMQFNSANIFLSTYHVPGLCRIQSWITSCSLMTWGNGSLFNIQHILYLQALCWGHNLEQESHKLAPGTWDLPGSRHIGW